MGVSPVCVLLSIGLCVCVRVEVFRQFDLLKHKVFWWLFRFVCLLVFSVLKFQIPDLDSATVIGRVKPVAVSNLLGGKSLDSENFHWKISNRVSDISNLWKSVSLCSFLGAVEWTPSNIWTALFEKETYKRKPPRLKCSKMPRLGTRREISLTWVVSISRDYRVYLTLLGKFSQNSNCEENSENR